MKLKSIRQTFKPDDKSVFVKEDLSQAEDRLAKAYCGSKRMLDLANTPPWEFDVHTDNAATIFGNRVLKLDRKSLEFKQLRYLGKKVVHASWRKMGGNKMSDSVSKDTRGEVFIPPKECQGFIKKFLGKNPEIEGFYFPFVDKQIYKVGILFNSWGRRFDVRNIRIDDNLKRKCYSFYPQAECADWTNQKLLKPAYKYMMAKYGRPPNLQIHDEVVASVPLSGIYDYCMYTKEKCEEVREIPAGSGQTLTIPLEVKISDTLYGGIEFSQIPEKKIFEAQVKEYLYGE